MYVSDFTRAESTQQLLYLLFSSEIGLCGVSHPEVQLDAIKLSFSNLQQTLAHKLQNGYETFEFMVSTPEVPAGFLIPLSYRKDAQYFKALYEGLPCWPVEVVLRQHVYPIVGDLVNGNKALKEATLALLGARIQRYGTAVGNRIRDSLVQFDLAALAPSLPGARA
jgi:hypothetical protein